MQTQSKAKQLVVDTAAFIKGVKFERIGEEFYTLPEVLDEVKDSKAKQFLASFPFEIKQRQPHPDTLAAVIEFSKKTGDYQFLSLTDLKVIALTYTLEREARGTDSHIRREPLSKPEVVSKVNKNFFNPQKTVILQKPQLQETQQLQDEQCGSDDSGEESDEESQEESQLEKDQTEAQSLGEGQEMNKDQSVGQKQAELKLEKPVSLNNGMDKKKEPKSWAALLTSNTPTSAPIPKSTPKTAPTPKSAPKPTSTPTSTTKPVSAPTSTSTPESASTTESTSTQEPKSTQESKSTPALTSATESKSTTESALTQESAPAPILSPEPTTESTSTTESAPSLTPASTTESTSTTESAPALTPASTKESTSTTESAPSLTPASTTESTSTTESAPSLTPASTTEPSTTPSKKSNWGMGSFGDKDKDLGWITPENIQEYTKAYSAVEGTCALDSSTLVACLTTDFAMQNVLIQMNLQLVSVDGLLIKRTQKWIKHCFICRQLCKDVDKTFCPNCGYHTLEKVSYSVDQEGNVTYHLNKSTHSLRGTKYPIPLPKGGRNSKDLLLYETRLRRPKSETVNINDPDELFLEKKKSQQRQQQQFGYGRKNPNVARKKIGKKNKTTRRNNI